MTKEKIEEAIYYHNYKEMKIGVSSYKKLEEIKYYDFTDVPEYMNDKSLENARMAFRMKSGMANKIKMNFNGSYKHNPEM